MTESTRITGYVCAAALFSAAAFTFPFAAVAQDVSPQTAAAPVPAQAVSAPTASLSAPAVSSSAPAAAPATTLSPGFLITVVDGKQSPRSVATSGPTVADALRDSGITLSHDDRVSPGLTTPAKTGMRIVVTRVHFVTDVVTKSIPYHTVFRMSRSVPPGQISRGRKGVPGLLTITYRTGYVNGKQTSRWLVSSQVTRPPVDQETLGGIRVQLARALPSRGGVYDRMRALTMVATGYSPYEGSGSGRCATGMRAGYGVVAVDPRVIHLGTRLYIQGYGYAVAGDTGGAIKGRRIDLGSSTYREAAAVGRRRVKVWVLAPNR